MFCLFAVDDFTSFPLRLLLSDGLILQKLSHAVPSQHYPAQSLARCGRPPHDSASLRSLLTRRILSRGFLFLCGFLVYKRCCCTDCLGSVTARFRLYALASLVAQLASRCFGPTCASKFRCYSPLSIFVLLHGLVQAEEGGIEESGFLLPAALHTSCIRI